MRWKGIIFLAVIVALLVLVSLLFTDRWFETRLEKIGGAIVGAKVDVDNLDLHLARLSVSWDRLQVTDPDHTMSNIIETGRAAFTVNAPALFRKRIVIEEMTLADMRSGTPRQYDGALPKKLKRAPKSEEPTVFDRIAKKLEGEIDKLPVMNFDVDAITRNLNLDSLIVMADLKMVGRIDSSKRDIIATADKWNEFYRNFHPDEDLKKIRQDFESIDPAKVRNLLAVASTLEKARSIQNRLNTLNTTVTTKHREIQGDFDRLARYTSEVDDWAKEDYRSVMAKAKLPDLTVSNIGKILFGGTIVDQINRSLGYVRTIREYMPKKSDRPEVEKRARLAGRDIVFPSRYLYPSFLIKKIHISGETGVSGEGAALRLSGDVEGITSQPWVYGRPTVIDLKGLQENKLSGIFSAVLDHTTDVASDSFTMRFVNKSLNNFDLYRSQYLPTKVSKGMGDITYTMRFKEDNFLSEIDARVRDLRFDFAQLQTSNRFVDITREVINSVDLVTLNTRIYSSGEDLRFRLDSNLDNLVSRKLQSMGSQALTDAQNKINARLNSIKESKMAEAKALLEEKRAGVTDKIGVYVNQVKEEKAKMEAQLKKIPGF